MRYVLVLWTGLLTGCDQPYGEGLARDSLRHGTQRVPCIAGDSGACTPIAEAYRRRFFDGKGGPNEYGALEQLPPIPPTFDAPLEADPDQSRRLLSRPGAAHE
jgi:hypothetical protein